MAIKIGITGGIGSGKSTVSRLLEVLGVPVYISDLETKRLMVSDSFIREELSALLGAEVYAGGTLNKPLLASYLFGSPEHAKEINCIVHPRVKEDFRRWTQCRTAFPIVGIESAILVEAGFAGEVYAGGTLNKPLLASYLFGSPEHAKEINCIVHPRVKEDFRRWTQCRTAFPIVGIESAILVEAGFAGEVDAIVMVYAPEEVRILRAVRRDASSRELIEKRIRSQMNDEEKRKYADFVIVNDGETPLIPQVLELIGSLSEKMHYLLRK